MCIFILSLMLEINKTTAKNPYISRKDDNNEYIRIA